MHRIALRYIHQIHHSKLLGSALFALAIFHLAMQLFVVMPRNLAGTDREDNIRVYYRAFENAYNRQPIYRIQHNYGPDSEVEGVYIYPPPFAALGASLSKLPFVWFVRLWYCCMFVALWVFAWSLARLSFGDDVDVRRVLIWGLIVDLFPGGYAAFSVGQIEPLLWALFGVGLVGLARPALWMINTLIKPFYVWPFLADCADLLLEKGVKALLRQIAPALILIAVLVMCGGLVCGWNSYLVWARDVLPTLSQGNFNSSNVSLSFAVLRVARFCGWNYGGGPLPAMAHWWLSIMSIAAPFVAWRLLRGTAKPLAYASMAAVAVLCAPVCWTYYLPLLLPPLAVLFAMRNGTAASPSI